ncbi:leucine-rich repeat extensin-like protein 5 [Brachypodium distachyon]|uniref:Bifunctional inhibitor/plant lipid transfer protein/seed storage helical domain-containing protein n=1 Tax=Brachypodium distachyon TaxID=15368 RepID=A0A0Q3GWY9_BRADI|nr:leucine-rich repeat extensin-like protein 5 [Brachypodium distachyon]KQK15504.2 hypothetical protein BRADI_1g23311v3 [Brachypodium distachyon]|eukprot:XP_024313186.1 leucine-rich repeat extensin-like protein 5 [Brachypodium distachyon]
MTLSKHLVALFFAFAVVATTLQPSGARLQGFEEVADQTKTAATSVGCSPGFPSPPGQLPLPQTPSSPGQLPLPQTPGFPSLPPLFGAPPSPPPPKECLTSLVGMAPCMDYLTKITVITPPSMCCDGLKSVITNAPICLCHGMNGGMSKLFPKPIDPIRMLILPFRCGAFPPLQTIFQCATTTLPPLMPPTSPAAPAPPASPAPPLMSSASPAPTSSPVSPP